jgi:hypothetical protein
LIILVMVDGLSKIGHLAFWQFWGLKHALVSPQGPVVVTPHRLPCTYLDGRSDIDWPRREQTGTDPLLSPAAFFLDTSLRDKELSTASAPLHS